jgi:acyl dehydratase
MQFGRCYEEFEVGALYKHWPGRTITESDDMLFCMLTMNHNPLHIDANYTENTEFKQPLVAGPLVFSIALGMSVGDVSGMSGTLAPPFTAILSTRRRRCWTKNYQPASPTVVW